MSTDQEYDGQEDPAAAEPAPSSARRRTRARRADTAAPEVAEEATDVEPAQESAPLLTLRDGMPPVIDTDEGLLAAAAALAAGHGPVGIDAERASGYRYSNRAYLIQLRREGSGSWMIDPLPLSTMQPLIDALEGTEWILHAATQDLPCLAELGLRPTALFDTELAGRLLGYPRVGLGALVESVLGFGMLKEHSAADWSTRPLPDAWLEYAALDVEVLIELREAIQAELVTAGKAEWARQEFDALRFFEPAVRVEPWRRVNGSQRLRGQHLAAVRELWTERDAVATEIDSSPGRILPDSAIVVAAQNLPATRGDLIGLKGFHGRGASKYAARWLAALERAAALEESEWPGRAPRTDGPPPARAWGDRDTVAARRLSLAREDMAMLAEQHSMPVENLLTPDFMRRVLWTPPKTRKPGDLLDAVADQLAGFGARGWQIALTAPLLTHAIIDADAPVAFVEPDPADD